MLKQIISLTKSDILESNIINQEIQTYKNILSKGKPIIINEACHWWVC